MRKILKAITCLSLFSAVLFGAVSCKNNVDDGVEIGLDQFASYSSKYYSLTATIDTNDPSKDGYKNKTFSATGHLWVSKFAGKEVYNLGFDEGNNGNWDYNYGQSDAIRLTGETGGPNFWIWNGHSVSKAVNYTVYGSTYKYSGGNGEMDITKDNAFDYGSDAVDTVVVTEQYPGSSTYTKWTVTFTPVK